MPALNWFAVVAAAVTSEKTATGWVERRNLLYQREPRPALEAAP